MNSYPLHELLRRIKEQIADAFPQRVWVRAEISECRENMSGHFYLELIEKDEADETKTLAKVRANVWANTFRMMKPYFEETTGMSFCAGMKILVQVSPEFHEVFGLSLNITDIDPAFTLGDIALQRDKILQRLRAEGVADMNRELPMPALLKRVAVISSPTAAGYGDFINQLENNRYGYAFSYKLFPAKMQGEQTSSSIIAALEKIFDDEQTFDVVVVIRGGGATSDLASFDDYDLAYYCTQFPLPLVVGIGHQRDNTVLDSVAHNSLKTPTAVAEFLIESFLKFDEEVQMLRDRIADCAQILLDDEERKSLRLFMRMLNLPDKIIANRRRKLDETCLKFRQAAFRRIFSEKQMLLQCEKRLDLCSPDVILQKGFVRVLKDGKVVRSAAQLALGDSLTISLNDGNVVAKVTEK